jgi:hypothetical protein
MPLTRWSLLLLAVLQASVAQAQQAQVAVHLNDPVLANQYLSVSVKTGLEPSSAYTIEAWVNPIDASGFPTIVGNDYTSSYWVGLGNSGHVRFYPRGGAGSYFEGVTSVPLHRWTHVAVTYNSATGAAIYINGVLDASSGAFTGAVGTSAGDLRIGADRETGSPAYFWRGGLDEIRIWDVARTAAEIAFSFRIGIGRRSQFTNGYYDHLQALWDMTLPFTTATPDVAGGPTSHLATFVGGDGYLVSEPGPPTSDNTALALNGIDDHAVMPMADGFGAGLTIDAWVAPTSFSNYPTIVGRDYQTSFWFGFNVAGQLRFYPIGGAGKILESPNPIPLGKWTHVAATYQPGLTTLYVNGVVVATSTAYTGSVGENGRDVWIGADNEAGFPGASFPFAGYLDNVRISRGPWSALQIRQRRFQGAENFTQPLNYLDNANIGRETWEARFGQREGLAYTVAGSSAHLVRSGAPMLSYDMDMTPSDISGFLLNNLGGVGTLPDDQDFSGIGVDLSWPSGITISSVYVFVTAPLNDLVHTLVRARSPLGTWVNLVTPGDAAGMDLHTIFRDDSPNTFAASSAPFNDGVRPSQPLSAWNGQSAAGLWRVELSSDGTPSTRVGLWAWGIELNGMPLAVGNSALQALALRNTGANPVRGTGSVSFGLAHAAEVELSLFDVQGRAVRTLLAGRREAGTIAMGWSAAGLSPGSYFLRLRVNGEPTSSLKVTVVH